MGSRHFYARSLSNASVIGNEGIHHHGIIKINFMASPDMNVVSERSLPPFSRRLTWASLNTSLWPPVVSLQQSNDEGLVESMCVGLRWARAEGPGCRLWIPEHHSAASGRGGRVKILPEPSVEAFGGSANVCHTARVQAWAGWEGENRPTYMFVKTGACRARTAVCICVHSFS